AFKGFRKAWSAAGCPFLTKAKWGAIKLAAMFRAARIALAFLTIFTIGYVLVIPNPNDDVMGVLRPSHFGKAQKLAVCFFQPLAPQIAMFQLPTYSRPIQRLTTLELVDLVCVYRC